MPRIGDPGMTPALPFALTLSSYTDNAWDSTLDSFDDPANAQTEAAAKAIAAAIVDILPTGNYHINFHNMYRDSPNSAWSHFKNELMRKQPSGPTSTMVVITDKLTGDEAQGLTDDRKTIYADFDPLIIIALRKDPEKILVNTHGDPEYIYRNEIGEQNKIKQAFAQSLAKQKGCTQLVKAISNNNPKIKVDTSQRTLFSFEQRSDTVKNHIPAVNNNAGENKNPNIDASATISSSKVTSSVGQKRKRSDKSTATTQHSLVYFFSKQKVQQTVIKADKNGVEFSPTRIEALKAVLGETPTPNKIRRYQNAQRAFEHADVGSDDYHPRQNIIELDGDDDDYGFAEQQRNRFGRHR